MRTRLCAAAASFCSLAVPLCAALTLLSSAIIGLVLSFDRVRKRIMADPFRCLVLASCALVAVDILCNRFVFDATALFNRVPQHYLAIMVLGMAVHYADSTRQKWIASVVAVLVIGELDVVAIAGYGLQDFALRGYIDVSLPAVLALIWLRSVPVPSLLARAGAAIASSTLYIYLTHFQFQSVAKRIIDQPVFAVILAIVGGVVVGYCWNTLVRVVVMRWNRGAKKGAVDTAERAV